MSLFARIPLRRRLVAAVTRAVVEGGGIFVVISIAMIFVVLAVNVWPLFQGAKAGLQQSLPVPGSGTSLHYVLDEYVEVGVRVSSDGEIVVFSIEDGTVWERQQFPGTDTARVISHATAAPHHGAVVLGLDDGSLAYARIYFETSFDGDRQTSIARVAWPLGEQTRKLDETGAALRAMALTVLDEENIVVAALTSNSRVVVADFQIEENLFTEELEINSKLRDMGNVHGLTTGEPQLLLSATGDTLYIAAGDTMDLYDLGGDELVLRQRLRMKNGQDITAADWMASGTSMLTGFADGTVAQWFHVAGEYEQPELTMIRSFNAHSESISLLAVEYNRRTFAAISNSGKISSHHTTSDKKLWRDNCCPIESAGTAVFSPRGDALLLDTGSELKLYQVHNPHPEYSLQSVWNSIWYENRTEPRHVWQSSSASADFEPKFSLTPLLFGTMKAAFYTMLFSIPIAIFAACYSACFMSRRLRQVVKPAIEMLAAIPTVILGFVAGLWLAPVVEIHLGAVFIAIILVPLTVVLLALLWQYTAAARLKQKYEGWEPVLLAVPVLLAMAMSLWLGAVIDNLWFDGQLSVWLAANGIDYSQRNALVVGIIMGVAVMPIIYSISEDAMYEVPQHLVNGSLALGASRWQTMLRIVLLTASPALFSAIMIGLGRAVGETMIVVMATGNTPIMDFNIFEGFRAISANVAVEIPEAEKNSTHFRILFLATMLLFVITFVLNTIAEVVRHKLRQRYSNL